MQSLNYKAARRTIPSAISPAKSAPPTVKETRDPGPLKPPDPVSDPTLGSSDESVLISKGYYTQTTTGSTTALSEGMPFHLPSCADEGTVHWRWKDSELETVIKKFLEPEILANGG